jgi:hypothetical protein
MNSQHFMLALPESIIAAEGAIPEEGRRHGSMADA